MQNVQVYLANNPCHVDLMNLTNIFFLLSFDRQKKQNKKTTTQINFLLKVVYYVPKKTSKNAAI